MQKKTIRIECRGSGTLRLDELNHFQGNLKNLSRENYVRGKTTILENGFSEPISVWKDSTDDQWKILNGHQRVRILREMRDVEGYEIPPLPVSEVEAGNEKEAKLKVLSLTSSYGNMTGDGLYEFMHNANLDLEDLAPFNFSDVNLPLFQAEYFGGPTFATNAEEWEGMPEFNQEDKTAYQTVQLHFFDAKGVSDFAKLIKQSITEKTRTIWFPMPVIERAADKRYAAQAPVGSIEDLTVDDQPPAEE